MGAVGYKYCFKKILIMLIIALYLIIAVLTFKIRRFMHQHITRT